MGRFTARPVDSLVPGRSRAPNCPNGHGPVNEIHGTFLDGSQHVPGSRGHGRILLHFPSRHRSRSARSRSTSQARRVAVNPMDTVCRQRALFHGRCRNGKRHN